MMEHPHSNVIERFVLQRGVSIALWHIWASCSPVETRALHTSFMVVSITSDAPSNAPVPTMPSLLMLLGHSSMLRNPPNRSIMKLASSMVFTSLRTKSQPNIKLPTGNLGVDTG